jgi:hypothetical protein
MIEQKKFLLNSNRGKPKEHFSAISFFYLAYWPRKRRNVAGQILNFPIFPVFIYQIYPER